MENLKLFLSILVLEGLIVACSFGLGYNAGNRRGFNEGYKAGQGGLFLEMTIHDSKAVQRFAKAKLVGSPTF